MLPMATDMAAVYCAQSLVELQFVEVCMKLRAKPLAKALHYCVALLMHLLLAKRATPVKEPREEIPQHAFALPMRIPNRACQCTIVMALQITGFRPVTLCIRQEGCQSELTMPEARYCWRHQQ